MKKKNTTAILLATVMMLTLMGCGDSAASAPESKDTASVAEVNTDSDTKTDSTSDTSTDESSDSSSSESTDKTDSATISLSDGSIEYKGESFSALDDLQTNFDKAEKINCTPAPDSPKNVNSLCSYDYDPINDGALFSYGLSIQTTKKDGTEAVLSISSNDQNSTTSKGIHPGSTKDELIAAYGEPSVKYGDTNESYVYISDKYILSFIVNKDKVLDICSENPAYSDYSTP